MNNLFKILVLLAVFLPGCVFVKLPGPAPLVEKEIDGEGRYKIVLMDVSGVITPDDRDGPLGIRTTRPIIDRIKEELKLAEKDSSVKAVILRIDSPGGAVTTCDIIAHEIKEFKKRSGAKVVAQLMDVSASGAYYIAASADEIIAHPTTITGSIGVVAVFIDASGLLQKVGITDQTIKSGRMKDMGTPLRTMTPEEREVMQKVIDSLYERFLDVVAEGRPEIGKAALRKLADGRVYTARQALEHGLIDRIGYMDDAVALARELAGVDKARIVTYAPAGSYRNNIYSTGGLGAGLNAPATINLLNVDLKGLSAGAEFLYLWMP